MLIFHEGLPGSGKSYAAIKDHLVPALQKGRKVCAYIEGLDHDRIAMVAGITVDRCRELLLPITREQVPEIDKYVVNDSFVIIDELQNFWPAGRMKLSAEITQFVTEHRHRGLDILCMGQVMQDCHNMWRNRIDQNVAFFNRDVIGKPNSYKWSVRKRESNGKFLEVTAGTAEYDPTYFGCYASHAEGTSNIERFADKRANIWTSPIVRRWLPIAGAAALISLIYVVYLFKGGLAASSMPKAVDKSEVLPVATKSVSATAAATLPIVNAMPVPVPEAAIEYRHEGVGDLIEELSQKYRIRLGGMIAANGRSAGYIEWRDVDNGLKEVLSFRELAGLGWLVLVSPEGSIATLTKVSRKYVATSWPVNDYQGRLTESQKRSMETDVSERAGKS